MKEQHTAGRWSRSGNLIRAGDGRRPVAFAAGRCLDESLANARRIAAAVTACDGIPVEALEAGVVADMLAACKAAAALEPAIDVKAWYASDAVPATFRQLAATLAKLKAVSAGGVSEGGAA